ncbi:DUF4926 domain-containing protein [Scytonema sp. NUACC26]|uniref:DUF4926 domain-containing protein n=1 Tax=Scytonema sp. NUACC26 TaxID=3140176 RepID=UPI0034DC9563
MLLEQYSVIQLVTNRYQDRGVKTGAIGIILEVYGDEAYEVEFSREDGTTIAWFAVQQNEVKPYDESSLNAVSKQVSNPTF